jgi:hypothetical protein
VARYFTLYPIYGVVEQGQRDFFDLGRLPFEIAQGISIEDVAELIQGEFKHVEKRMGKDDADQLQKTHYALVYRFEAAITVENGEIVQEHEHVKRGEQLVRKVAACLRLIRPMRQSSNFMRGTIRNDGTFNVNSFQSPANLMEVPEIQKLFDLRNQDADDLRTYFPGFLRAMDGNIWKFKMAVQFHELGYWSVDDQLMKGRYLLWSSAIESLYTTHNSNHRGSKVAKARISYFLGKGTPIYSPTELCDALLSDPHVTIGSIVDDLYEARNYIAHGDKIPDRFLTEILRDGTSGPLPTYAVLFEAQSFIIRNTLLKILQEDLLRHFADAGSAEAYFGAQGLTNDKLS